MLASSAAVRCSAQTSLIKDLSPVTHPSRLHADPRSHKLDARFFKRMYALAKPYWTRKGAWRSWIVLVVMLALVASFSVFGAYFSYLTKDQTNALVARKVPEF
jgi:putative ATP-binding cassette transporter